MSIQTPKTCQKTPITLGKVCIQSHSNKLQPFDQNYTLTGLLKDIESTIGLIISSKKSKQAEVLQPKYQLELLEKVQEEVFVLKTLFINNINQIFASIYPSTNNQKITTSPDHRNDQHLLQNQERSRIISDFSLQGIQRSPLKENYNQSRQIDVGLYHNKLINSSSEINSNRQTKKQEHAKNKQILIQEDDDLSGLICYEDDEVLSERKGRDNPSKNYQVFSPIEERPIQQEYSVQKINKIVKEDMNQQMLMKMKNRMQFVERQKMFLQLFKKEKKEQKSPFSRNCQTFRKKSNKKFNYLQQYERLNK